MPQQAMSNVGLNFNWDSGQDGWKAGMDNNLVLLDALVQGNVADKDLNTPPGGAALGDRYIVGGAPTGAWASKANQVAVYDGAAWRFAIPREGWVLYVNDEDSAYRYTGSAWVPDVVESLTVKGSVSGAQSISFAAGGIVSLTLTGNVTASFTGAVTGKLYSVTVEVSQDLTGGWAITWPSSVKWPGGTAPALTADPNAIDILTFYTTDGGATIRGAMAMKDSK